MIRHKDKEQKTKQQQHALSSYETATQPARGDTPENVCLTRDVDEKKRQTGKA